MRCLRCHHQRHRSLGGTLEKKVNEAVASRVGSRGGQVGGSRHLSDFFPVFCIFLSLLLAFSFPRDEIGSSVSGAFIGIIQYIAVP